MVAPFQCPAVGQEVNGEEARGLDNVEHSIVVLQCFAERFERAIEVMGFVLAERSWSREVTCPKKDGVCKARMMLFGRGSCKRIS